MVVAELIAVLQQHKQDAVVCFDVNYGEYYGEIEADNIDFEMVMTGMYAHPDRIVIRL
jgi:hypothetical protein